jgi:hypothetical protein
MASTSISVPCTGDRNFVKALKALAYRNGQTMADLVRDTLTDKHGNELQPLIEFFVAQNGDKNNQSETKVATPEPA